MSATAAAGRPRAAAAAAVGKGPWVRAKRPTTSPRGSATGVRSASGIPGGRAAPRASRNRAASSTAAQWASPARRTSTTRPARAEVFEEARRVVVGAAGRHPLGGQRAQPPQEVGHPIGAGDEMAGGQVLQLELDPGDRLGVEQFAQFRLAEQVAQQGLVDGEGGGAPLGRRGVVLIEEGGHEVEAQRGSEGAGPGGAHRRDPDAAGGDVGEDLPQGGQVEVLLQHLAVGLEHDGEVGEAAGGLEQAPGPAALHPQRGALPGAAAGEEQGAGRRLAEGGAEEGAAPGFLDHQALRLVGLEGQFGGAGGLVGVGEAQDEPVVGPDRVHLDAVALAQPAGGSQRPRGMDPGAEGGEQHQAPVADLVAVLLDDHAAVGGQGAGGRLLLGQVLHQVGGGALVEVVVGHEERLGRGGVEGADGGGELAQGPAGLQGAARGVALPEGEAGGDRPRGRGHHHPVQR